MTSPGPSNSFQQSSAASVQEFKIRVPKNVKKKHHVMRFNATLNVDFAKWTHVKMERENNIKEFKGLDEDMPKFGAGSEYGRDVREEARRKKFGIISRKYKPEDQPWILKVGGKTGKKFKGIREGGVSEHAAYYVFTHAADGAIDAYPLQEWYNFQPIQRYKALSAEEADEEFGRWVKEPDKCESREGEERASKLTKKKKSKPDDNKKDSSSELSSDSDTDIEGSTTTKKPKKSKSGNDKNGPAASTSAAGSANTSRRRRAQEGEERASKLTKKKKSKPDDNKKDSSSELSSDSDTDIEGSTTTKKPKKSKSGNDKNGPAASTSAAGSANTSRECGVTEEAVRRYLARKPMTTTELLTKFKSKRTGVSSDRLVETMTQILKRINPVKQNINGKMYLSINNT
uniref:Transcription initiation factor IIF subunit alpha n=1 Tax=Heliothis virescens TaxID=7102 RepID=A0A2A4ITP0_HELVI